MRFYEITFAKSGSPIKKMVLDKNNPYALGIKFNIQSFSDSNAYIPSTLTITNPATSFFTNTQGLLEMDVTLKAGITPSVYTNKLQLTQSTNDILYIGKVARVVPQWQGLNPSITLLLSSTIVETRKDENGNIVEKGYICIIEKGGVIAEGLKNTLADMLPSLIVEITESAKTMTLQDNQTMQREVKNFIEITNLATQLGITFAIDKNKLIMYSKKKGYNNNVLPFKPKLQDFLSQPEYQNHSTIQCIFGLRGDLQLQQELEMPKIMLNAGSLINDTGSLAGISNANALIDSNTYKITGIWHTGDSRNSSALAWATTISATSTKNLANK